MAGEYPQMTAPQGADYGFLGGMFDTRQQQDAIAARELSRQGQGLANLQQSAVTDRYTQETPWIVQQSQGLANTVMAKGDVDQYTKEATMKQKLAEALAGKSEAELKKGAAEAESMVQKLTGAKARYLQAAQVGQGPQAALQIATEFGFDMNDPKVAAQLQPVLNNPKQFQAVLDSYTKSYQAVGQATAARVEKQKEIQMAKDAAIKGHEISAGATIKAAQIAADSRRDIAEAKQGQTKAENETQMLARLYNVAYLDNTAAPEQKQAAIQAINAYNQDKLARQPAAYAAPGIDLPSMTGKPGGVSPIEKSRAVTQTTGTPAEEKTINGTVYVKVPGGWKRK